MSKVVYSALITKISGKMGNMVFASWKGVGVLRSLATSISNPKSDPQMSVRDIVTYLGPIWGSSDMDDYRPLWGEYAQKLGAVAWDNSQQFTLSIAPKPGRLMSGYNAFIGINNIFLRVTASAFEDYLKKPPTSISALKEIPSVYSTDISGSSGVLVATVIPRFAPTRDCYLVPWLRRKIKGAHSYAQIPNLTTFDAGDDTSQAYTIDLIRVGHGLSIDDVPMQDIAPFTLQVQFQLMDTTGARGSLSRVYEIPIALI